MSEAHETLTEALNEALAFFKGNDTGAIVHRIPVASAGDKDQHTIPVVSEGPR
nr:hypothetical protein [Polymorphobacter sp.]